MAMVFTTRHRSVRRQAVIGWNRLCSRKQQQRQRLRPDRSSLPFSQSAYEDPTLAWARSNPRLAQECLNPPPAARLGPSSGSGTAAAVDSLESYLEWRGWTVPEELRDDEPERATALISHVLSAPLTLASHFGLLAEHRDWCCVGARAEAGIPTAYWKEFLLLSSDSGASSPRRSGEPSRSGRDRLELSIDFVGPDIPPKLAEQSVRLAEGGDGRETAVVASLSLRGHHRGLFHDVPAVEANADPWDAYLLFNPGVGHPNLRVSWEPTLNAILGTNHPRRRPGALLLTAHSERDMARDAAILRDVYGLENLAYRENPFASRVSYEDPLEKHHFVRPNHYVAAVAI
mmetsp:Transcript_25016/g.58694  ORF Transcript_25016/g.58694 Transcript_25016/m.58694 type:complete len:345 (-) Transcript_25016:107-1141(-)